MKHLCTFLFITLIQLTISFIPNPLLAQPLMEWSVALGGTNWEKSLNCIQSGDGGYIIAGYTESNDGNVSGNHGQSDVWITRLGESGQLIWQKCFGGTENDWSAAIVGSLDRGFVVACQTSSNDGDVTGYMGLGDIWVFKIDSSGDLLWQNCFGGTSGDYPSSVIENGSNGYFVTGCTNSNDGDVTGNHGDADTWVLNLGENGNLLWQKCLGGTSTDCGFGACLVPDGFAVAGASSSTDGDVTSNNGLFDYWIMRLSNSGNITWQRSLGGSENDFGYSIEFTADGNLVVAGDSYSNDGYVTGNHNLGQVYTRDYWVVKLSLSGTLIWQKCFGGIYDDGTYCIQQSNSNGYIMAGEASSHDGDVTGSNGGYDYWIVQCDEDGNLIWQQTYGGSGNDKGSWIEPTMDGGYLVTGYVESNDGDISGNHGSTDIWVVKMAGCTFANDISVVAGTLNFCLPGSVTLASSAVAISFQWYLNNIPIVGATNPTYLASGAGTYHCLATQSCGSVSSNTIFVNAVIVPVGTVTPSGTVIICAGDTALLTVNTTATNITYRWLLNGNPIVGATNSTYNATAAGKYRCRLRTIGQPVCGSFTNVVKVVVPCRVESSDTKILVYPNPFSEYFIVESPEATLELFDLAGKRLFNLITASGNEKISAANLPAGVYLLHVIVSNGHSEVFRIIKE